MGYWMAEAHGQTRGRQEAPPASVTEGDPPPGYPFAQIPLIFRARSQSGHPPTFLSGHRWAMPTLQDPRSPALFQKISVLTGRFLRAVAPHGTVDPSIGGVADRSALNPGRPGKMRDLR